MVTPSNLEFRVNRFQLNFDIKCWLFKFKQNKYLNCFDTLQEDIDFDYIQSIVTKNVIKSDHTRAKCINVDENLTKSASMVIIWDN